MSRETRGDDTLVNLSNKNSKRKEQLKRWILPLVILFLTLSSVFLIAINKSQTEERLGALGQETVKIMVGDEMVDQFNLDEVKALPKVLIDEGLNTSNGREEVVFGGLLLKDVLNTTNFDYHQYNTITYKAIDGYASLGTVAELDEGGVYLVYERNGIQNTDKTQGGTGPMEIVITGETFSLRNCKYLSEIYFE